MRRDFIDNDNGVIQTYIVCPHCGKKFKCTLLEQIPGYRFKEQEICPYCDAVLRESLEFEFISEKLEER